MTLLFVLKALGLCGAWLVGAFGHLLYKHNQDANFNFKSAKTSYILSSVVGVVGSPFLVSMKLFGLFLVLAYIAVSYFLTNVFVKVGTKKAQ